MSRYERGDTARIDLEVRHPTTNALVDPTGLVFDVLSPTMPVAEYVWQTDLELVHDSTGKFHFDLWLTDAGMWSYKWVTTDPNEVTGEKIHVVADTTDLATIEDYAKVYLGGENWSIIYNSANFGPTSISLAIDTIKRRIMTNPPPTPGESALDPRLLDFFGILTALQLIPAVRDAWANRAISRSIGNDPAEVTTYTDRSLRIDNLRDDLLRKLPGIQAIALPFIDVPLAVQGSRMAIDENADSRRVTENPRTFPPARTFPYSPSDVLILSDPWWIGLRS
jgi:hypothetical protein